MHNDEQLNELEALTSIFPSELQVVSEPNSFPISFSIQAKSDECEPDDDSVSCVFLVTLPPAYPDEAPEMDIEDFSENLADLELKLILDNLNKLALENVGMAACFTLINALQEELNTTREKLVKKREDEMERRKYLAEEVERKRFDGTAVTVENFMAWKLKFDQELRELRVRQGYDVTEKISRPTGRLQFLTDADLCTSDIRLIEESGEEIKIDESLFDDLDIEDEEILDDGEN